jgi:hypothetical protein
MRMIKAIFVAGAAIAATALIVALILPAHAQGRRHQPAAQTAGNKPTKADEQAYKDALKRIPDKKVDPWGNMR